MDDRGRLRQDTHAGKSTDGDEFGMEWAEWGVLGSDAGGLNCAP